MVAFPKSAKKINIEMGEGTELNFVEGKWTFKRDGETYSYDPETTYWDDCEFQANDNCSTLPKGFGPAAPPQENKNGFLFTKVIKNNKGYWEGIDDNDLSHKFIYFDESCWIHYENSDKNISKFITLLNLYKNSGNSIKALYRFASKRLGSTPVYQEKDEIKGFYKKINLEEIFDEYVVKTDDEKYSKLRDYFINKYFITTNKGTFDMYEQLLSAFFESKKNVHSRLWQFVKLQLQ
jgi:hypothetical protein